MKDVAIIIPAYNESLTIEGVIQQFYEQMPEAYQVVVDNRSSDGTGEIASRVMAELSVHGEVIFEGMPGKGNALKRAFRDVEAQVYVIVDADLTYFASFTPSSTNSSNRFLSTSKPFLNDLASGNCFSNSFLF